jgi:hypothetical protein
MQIAANRTGDTMSGAYRVERSYKDDQYEAEVVATGLSLAEAQAHCKDPQTSSSTATDPEALRRTEERGDWFDNYVQERVILRTDQAEYRWTPGNATVNVYDLDGATEVDVFSFSEPPEDFAAFEAHIRERESSAVEH